MHDHNHNHHNGPTDQKTTRRIGLLSLWNLAFGSTVLYVGTKLDSPIIQMQGIHDTLDGGLNAIKYIAAKQKNTVKEIAWRKVAVLSLGVTALGFGTHELINEFQSTKDADSYTIPIAYGALAANLLGASIILGVRSNKKSKDAITHAVLFDLPASFVTVATTHLDSMQSLGAVSHLAETGGIMVHIALAGYAVSHTLSDINHTSGTAH